VRGVGGHLAVGGSRICGRTDAEYEKAVPLDARRRHLRIAPQARTPTPVAPKSKLSGQGNQAAHPTVHTQ